MSAMPTTITIDPVATTIARAYGEMAYGLARLTSAVQQGDLTGLLAARPAPAVAPVRAIALLVPPPDPRPADRFVAAMGLEVLKTGFAALVVYQALLSLLPAPDRPTFAPIAAEASPAGDVAVPSVNPAAHGAVGGQQHGGQQQEVEVDGDGGSGFATAP